jgi:hypothetical protein
MAPLKAKRVGVGLSERSSDRSRLALLYILWHSYIHAPVENPGPAAAPRRTGLSQGSIGAPTSGGGGGGGGGRWW